MTVIRTRVATLLDLEEIASLFNSYREFYEQAPDIATARDFIRERMQNEESVVLLANGESPKAIGFCQLYPLFCSIEAKPIYLLSDLFVAPEARRTGAGRALLEAARVYSSERGRVRMELTTARTNKAAQAAYESLGWVRDEIYFTYGKRTDA